MEKRTNKNYKIHLSPPHLSGKELEYVQEALESNWITTEGDQIDRFEHELSEYLDGRHVTLLNSGTAALHLACRLLNVGAGDFVLCQNFTFIATANPIRYQNATPVLIDSETDTWNMDPNALEDAIKYCIKKGRKPKAMIYVHIYGMPAKVNEILNIATRYEIPVIEDAAEGLGSKYGEKCVGQFGDISILSFNGNKIITSSGGGALITNSKTISERGKYLASQAKNEKLGYTHDEIGYNYRLSNVLAAIGRAQFNELDKRVTQKRFIFEAYYNRLNSYDLVQFQQEPIHVMSNRWLNCLLLKDRRVLENIYRNLEANEIEVRPLWKPINMQKPYKECLVFGDPNAQKYYEQGVSLPSGFNINDHELNNISDIIGSSLQIF